MEEKNLSASKTQKAAGEEMLVETSGREAIFFKEKECRTQKSDIKQRKHEKEKKKKNTAKPREGGSRHSRVHYEKRRDGEKNVRQVSCQMPLHLSNATRH